MLLEHKKNSYLTSHRWVIYGFLECFTNIPSGLSAYKPYKLVVHNSEDVAFFRDITGTISHSRLTNQNARIDLVII